MINKNKGFSLLEVLVTTFIFSFAMLSLALMQINGMQTGQSANLQNIANLQSMDILEKMRANRAGVMAGNYNITRSESPINDDNRGQVVNNELTAWKNKLATLLPGGEGSIQCDATAQCTIQIFWSPIHQDLNVEMPDSTFAVMSQL